MEKLTKEELKIEKVYNCNSCSKNIVSDDFTYKCRKCKIIKCELCSK